MSTTYQRISAATLGENRGRARIYLQGQWLLRADFAPGKLMHASFERGRVVLSLAADGERRVSGKRAGAVPVIDVTGAELAAALGGAVDLVVRARSGQIVITPSRTAAKRAARVKNGLEGALFAGAGFLSLAAQQAGLEPAFAVEWDERYAELYEQNHPGATVYNMDIAQVPVEELPQVELLTVGIPCEPFSTKRRGGDRSLPPEAHELGDMVVWALRVIDAVNPYTVVIEEVPAFLSSGAGWILRRALERLGYHVDARVVDSSDHGAHTRRKRAVIVATTDAAYEWPAEQAEEGSIADVLEEVPESEWFDRASKGWLFSHWDKQAAKGNHFGNQKFDCDAPCIGAISKRYFNRQGDSPVLRHPTRPDTYRWLTLTEVKRLHGVPDNYDLGGVLTVAGQVLGQGVVVPTFTKIILAARA